MAEDAGGEFGFGADADDVDVSATWSDKECLSENGERE